MAATNKSKTAAATAKKNVKSTSTGKGKMLASGGTTSKRTPAKSK